MAIVRINRREAEDDLLPRICALTGEPTDDFKQKAFAFTPRWTGFLILLGLIPYVIVAMLLTKRMTVRLPLVREKHGHWLKMQLFILGGIFLTLILGCGGALIAGNKDTQIVGAVLGIGGVVLFVVVLVAAIVLQQRMIRPLEITDREMRLAGVHEKFKEALDAMKEERYERRERRERDEPRAPRPRGERYRRGEDDDERM